MTKLVSGITPVNCSWQKFQLATNLMLRESTNFLAFAGYKLKLCSLKGKVRRGRNVLLNFLLERRLMGKWPLDRG